MEQVYIKDKEGNRVLTITSESAVRDANGNPLSSKLGVINDALNNRYTKSETYSKSQLDNLITTPNQKYVTVEADDQTTAATDVLPVTGEKDTIYRVGNWDGSAYDITCYSEYAWDGTAYKFLSKKSQIGEVYDISAANGNDTYTDLNDALTNGGVPSSLRKGGMSVKFILSSDNKYVQYRLTNDEWSTVISDWVEADSNKVDGNVLYVTDGSGNIIAKIDADGVHSVDFKYGSTGTSVSDSISGIPTQIATAVNAEKLLREHAVAAEESRAKTEENKKLNFNISDNAFYFTDSNGYIIAKVDKEGVHAPNLFEGKFDNDKLIIMDNNGYIIAKVDSNGVHSAKDKHAVACMVLSESYYPTAVPTIDSDGNVTFVKVMFETGIAGSISITYTNGNSSSVAVVYGNYNYTITINRDVDGNVETVSVN